MDKVVYIDTPRNGYSHLVGYPLDYLHLVVEQLGIKRCWYHNTRGKNRPHYDVREKDFQKCLDYEVELVSSKEIVKFLNKYYGG